MKNIALLILITVSFIQPLPTYGQSKKPFFMSRRLYKLQTKIVKLTEDNSYKDDELRKKNIEIKQVKNEIKQVKSELGKYEKPKESVKEPGDQMTYSTDEQDSLDKLDREEQEGFIARSYRNEAKLEQYKSALNGYILKEIEDMTKIFKNEGIDIKTDSQLVIFITLSEDIIRFETGEYKIGELDTPAFMSVTKILQKYENINFIVEGHTDNSEMRGPACLTDNWDLSCMRATEVLRTLRDVYSIDEKRMSARGMGEFKPVNPNNTRQNGKTQRKWNRRTNIVIYPNLSELSHLVNDGPEK